MGLNLRKDKNKKFELSCTGKFIRESEMEASVRRKMLRETRESINPRLTRREGEREGKEEEQ